MLKKIACIGLITILGLFCIENLYAQEQEGDKPYKQLLVDVEGRLRTGDFAGAIEKLDDIIAKYPDAAEVYYAKALLYGQARNFDMAIPIVEKAWEIEPKNMLYANYLVELHKSKGDLAAAVPVIDRAIEELPDNESLYREKMLLLHASKKSEEALQVYDDAVAKFGDSDTLDVMKAEMLVDLDKKQEAEKILLARMQENSGLRQVYSTLGFIYMDRNATRQAIQILEKGLKNTNDPLLYLDLADAYTAGKRSKQALESLRKAFESMDVNYMDKHRVMFTLLRGKSGFTLEQIQGLANILVLKHPRIADSHVAKGDVLWRRGNLQEARSLFLTAVGINRAHVDAWRMLMNVEMALNEVDQAVDHGLEALEANPNNPMLLYFTGLAYMVKDDGENARKLMEAALDNSGEDNTYLQSLIYAGLGDLYHKLGMADVSDVAYEEAIKLDSTNATAMNNYAYYLAERKEKLDLAEKLSRQSNELEPASATFQDTYAWVLFQQENYKEALKWIEKAVRGSSPSAVLYEHYGDILFKSGNSKDALKQWERALAVSDGEDIDVEKLKSKIATKSYVE
ncbi:tetratricopeptide repeat protein [Sphingobacterium sp. DN00404]|uniref:Tetratricopeptide repeat protein n=1 Tax=Sphingobacterium micropteri TaxID=2763501 RepID=A0ABR7YN43_9SPHI|nr:tetratricopeptide repeat protein [Sphingobacterium micropteri]MBD1432737.1 tetratricopeptide repeat protein [Sphingobacterium micropteri]